MDSFQRSTEVTARKEGMPTISDSVSGDSPMTIFRCFPETVDRDVDAWYERIYDIDQY